MSSKNLKFKIGFWHPFGPHAGETHEEIIIRKRDEIKKNGWTLWSFQFRNTLNLWYQEIQKNKPNNVLVFCSQGKGARDPISKCKKCDYFIPINKNKKVKIPATIEIPHPMGQKTQASAFIVKNIIYPADYKITKIRWFKDKKWQTKPLPTRSEYLIKSGNGKPMRSIRAILELKYPYLAEVGVNKTPSKK
jgi:hypothetical protein